MHFLDILIYSMIQGVSEFLPISSSAHLYVAEIFLDWNEKGVTFALAAHLGTLLAVSLFEKNELIWNFKKLLFNKKQKNILILIILCVLPVIVVGLIIITFFENNYSFGILTIAIASIAGAVLLELSDRDKEQLKIKDTLLLRDCVFIGLFQILSLIPGMSRAGTVITASRFLGYTRVFSIKLALLTSIPIIFMASSYGLYKLLISGQQIYLSFFFITFTTFVISFFSIKFLLKWINFFSFRIFVIYRLCFGIILLVMLF